VNKQITRLALAALVLMIALIVATTYWQTWAVAGLNARQDNAIQRVAQFKVKRGLILTRHGDRLAWSVRRRVGGQNLWFRRYPAAGLLAQTVGYSTQARSQAGLERYESDYLTGSNTNLGTLFNSTLDKLGGTTVKGNNVVLTINLRAQQIAMEALRGKCGSVVAIDPRTGGVLVMASSPTYNPNLVEKRFGEILKSPNACKGSSSPLLNRATSGLYTPGSTFKLVTAAAALDTGAFRPDSPFNDPGYCEEYGQKVYNAGNPDQGGAETFGNTNFFQGLQHSINSVFCNIGKSIGARVILDYAKRFGFYSKPALETPENERAPSGLYDHARLFDPKDPNKVDVGRMAFGQERMLVTPLQAAMIVTTIANGGIVIQPHVVDRITSPSGKTIVHKGREELRHAIKPQTAADIASMMVAAVNAGTGTAAKISGISVAGKTGTAETGVNGVNTTWFDAFAPAESARVAIAVVLEQQHGFGGTTAAPIAKTVMEALLRGASK
jgi:peptidoglycan glycosyltransferase